MNVKDIKVHRNSKLVNHWPLRKHRGDVCFDRLQEAPATAGNPHWLIDSHRLWRNCFTREFAYKNPQYAYDGKRDILYIPSAEDQLIAHRMDSGQDSIIPVREGKPASLSTNGLLYFRPVLCT